MLSYVSFDFWSCFLFFLPVSMVSRLVSKDSDICVCEESKLLQIQEETPAVCLSALVSPGYYPKSKHHSSCRSLTKSWPCAGRAEAHSFSKLMHVWPRHPTLSTTSITNWSDWSVEIITFRRFGTDGDAECRACVCLERSHFYSGSEYNVFLYLLCRAKAVCFAVLVNVPQSDLWDPFTEACF